MQELTALDGLVPFDPGILAVVESSESVLNDLERFGFLTHCNNLTLAYRVGRNVNDPTVDGDVAMENELTGSGACGSNTQTINHVVEPCFEELEEHLTGNALHARSLVEEVAELTLEHAIGVLSLLFFAKLCTVLREFPAAVGTTASAAGTDDDTVFVGEDEDEVDEEPEGEPIVVEPEVALRRITRTMFPDDLDIEVSTDAFDARFSVDDLVLFDEDRPRDNWINDYLNQASSDANMELRHMRASHIETLRSLYLRSMEASVSRIAQMLDDSDDDNEYGHSANIVRTRRDVAQADAENVARDRVRVLRDNFDREVRAAGEDAARLAEKQYRDRHGRRLENQERRMLSEVRREIDVECESSLAEIRERRRETALKLLEVATTTTLERLSQEYVTLRDIEDERMRELAAGIREYVEENRANDVAWTNSIESELDLSDKLDEVRAEYDDRIRRMDEAAEEERARLKTEMDELRERHSRELDDLREDNRVAMERARGERDALSATLDATMDDYRELDDKKDMQYKASMDSLRDRLAAADERYDTLVDREKRAQLIWIALAVVAIIAALCVGMVIGLNQRIGLESAVTYTQGV